MIKKIKKINWLESLPEKYKFNSNDKIELFLNNDKEKIFINKNRGNGATHYTVMEMMYYIHTNSNKEIAFVTNTRVSSICAMEDISSILLELFEDINITTNKNELYICIKDKNIKIRFIYNPNQAYGLKLNAVYVDNIYYVKKEVLENVIFATTFYNESYIVANYTPLFKS